MKHINIAGWKFSNEPFPAYRCNLIYGKNKRDNGLLPVKNIVPNEDGVLPEGEFKVIKTKEKGTILIVPGTDNTNRALVMTATDGGFRGGVTVKTTGQIIAIARAGNACESACHTAVILETGDNIVYYRYGRGSYHYIVFTWDGTELEKKVYTSIEWKILNETKTEAGNESETL